MWCQVECIGWSRDRWRNFSPFQEQQIFSNEILKICWNSRTLAFIQKLLSSSKFHVHYTLWWPWWLWQPLAVFSVTIFLRCVVSYWILISWWASPNNWPEQVFQSLLLLKEHGRQSNCKCNSPPGHLSPGSDSRPTQMLTLVASSYTSQLRRKHWIFCPRHIVSRARGVRCPLCSAHNRGDGHRLVEPHVCTRQSMIQVNSDDGQWTHSRCNS